MRIETKNQGAEDLDTQLKAWRHDIEDVLDRYLPVERPTDLIEAGRHGLLGKGKRVRALLVLACGHDLGLCTDDVMTGACAIEMVHAASLILDDMPCMDDALCRRGRETTHRAYGQSTAILSAIGLISRAFELIGCDSTLPPAVRAEMVEKLAGAIGYAGLTGGQHDDLFSKHRLNGCPDLKDLYTRKTGVLYSVALTFGGLAANLTRREIDILSSAGKDLGLAFQLLDDLLDACGTQESVGKDVHKDVSKTTAVSLYGVMGAMHEVDRLSSDVRSTLSGVLGYNATVALVSQISQQAVARMKIGSPSLSGERLMEK